MNTSTRLLCLLGVLALALAAATAATAQPMTLGRTNTLLSGPWRFLKSNTPVTGAEAVAFDDTAWTSVTTPHTFNSDKADYSLCSDAWYRLSYTIPDSAKGKTLYLYFEGVGDIATVYVNGGLAGTHNGGYTGFVFDITKLAKPGQANLIAVKADNKDTAQLIPDKPRLFKFYGGIYRKVWLVTLNHCHIDPTDDATSGVYVTPTTINTDMVTADIRTLVRNMTADSQKLTIKQTIVNAANGTQAAEPGETTITVPAGTRGEAKLIFTVKAPKLWSPTTPSLYSVETKLYAENGTLLDTVVVTTGFRDFKFNAAKTGFTLNGASLNLDGFCKHEETEAHGGAVTDEDIRNDFAALKDVGANFARLAHTPHTQLAYDQADELGIAIWAENGNLSGKATELGRTITQEMVRQNYNHPSILFWSMGNELSGGTASLEDYATVARAEDPAKMRLITYASNSGFNANAGVLAKAPHLDFVAGNCYTGWYVGGIADIKADLSKYHFISENGFGGSPETHCDYDATRFNVGSYEPEEYQDQCAEIACQTVCHDAPGIALYAWWNFREFADPRYNGVNSKGMLTFAGAKKDCYYLFKSFYRADVTVIHIASEGYFLRTGSATNGIKVYSNAAELTLTLNGVAAGTIKNGAYTNKQGQMIDNVFLFTNPLAVGKNIISVSDGKGHSDTCVLYYLPAGSTMPEDKDAPVQSLKSSNPQNPAYFIDSALPPCGGFYDNLDGTGDNNFDPLPAELAGACWISTKRLSVAGNITDLQFHINPACKAATVYVVMDVGSPEEAKVNAADFKKTTIQGIRRDTKWVPKTYEVYSASVHGSQDIALGGTTADYVIFVVPTPTQ